MRTGNRSVELCLLIAGIVFMAVLAALDAVRTLAILN
jgi:hypothetical protein